MTDPKMPVRRVGTLTLGVSLILAGLVGLGCYFIPGFNGWLVCRLSPVMLIGLGAEVLWGSGHGWAFSLSSVVCCLAVLGLCALLNLAYAVYSAGFQL